MNLAHFSLALVVLVLALGVEGRGDSTPSTRPSPGTLGDVRIQTLRPYSYAFVSTQTNFNKLRDTIDAQMPKLDAAIDAGKLRPMGPVVFTYHGATVDPNKEFTLDIGVIVEDGRPKPDGFQMITVGSSSCATVIYAGDISQLGQAWGKLYGEIGRRGLQPTNVCREVYLYWEGRESANNLIQLQAELSPSN
ncbi:MAG: GyrI-like domain-containing protein [Tepidisphaeraceae bacterium]